MEDNTKKYFKNILEQMEISIKTIKYNVAEDTKDLLKAHRKLSKFLKAQLKSGS